MGSAIAKTCALYSQTGDGAAQGDGAKLRNAERHESVGKGRGNEVLIGGHAAHFGGPSEGIYFKHRIECVYVQSCGVGRRAASKKITGLLCEPNRGIGRAVC